MVAEECRLCACGNLTGHRGGGGGARGGGPGGHRAAGGGAVGGGAGAGGGGAHPLCCSHTAVVQSSSRLRWRNAASALCAYRVMGEVVYIEPDRGHTSGQSMCTAIQHTSYGMLYTSVFTAHLACCMGVLPRSHMYKGYTYRCHSHAIQSPQPYRCHRSALTLNRSGETAICIDRERPSRAHTLTHRDPLSMQSSCQWSHTAICVLARG